jgi:four helix bundle protein
MLQTQNTKQYDLAKRTFLFAKNVRAFVNNIPKTIANIEDGKQLIRASGSVGANYIEANKALSRKDFYIRVKICRKESNENAYWLQLLYIEDDLPERERAPPNPRSTRVDAYL